MARSRVAGTSRSRPQIAGREPRGIGAPIGKGAKTRPIAQPPVRRTYTHCTGFNKEGQKCKAPNVKDKPFCIGHLNAIEARRRRATAGA